MHVRSISMHRKKNIKSSKVVFQWILTWTDFDKTFWKIEEWPKTNQLNFAGDPGHNPDQRISKESFTTDGQDRSWCQENRKQITHQPCIGDDLRNGCFHRATKDWNNTEVGQTCRLQNVSCKQTSINFMTYFVLLSLITLSGAL